MKSILVILLLASSGYALTRTEDAFFVDLQQVKEQFHTVDSKKIIPKLQYLVEKAKGSEQKRLANFAFHELYFGEGKYELSSNYLIFALNHCQKEKDRIEIYYLLGVNYYYLSLHDKGIYVLTKILHSNIIDKELKIKAKTETVLGLIYTDIDNIELSNKYYLRSLKTFTKLKDNLGMSQAWGNLGVLNRKKDNPNKALYYFKKSISFPIDYSDFHMAQAYSNIGAMLVRLKEPVQAKEYIDRAMQLSRKLGDKGIEQLCMNNYGAIYQDLGETKQSLNYYLEALSLLGEGGSKEVRKEILFNVSEAYRQLGNYEKSLDYYQQYTALKDELFDTEKSEFIVETQEKYEASQREKQIAELKVKKQQGETEKLAMKYTIIIGIIAVILIFVLIFWFQRAKSIRLKNEKNYAISTAALDSEEKERLRISQEIHDDLGGVLGMSRMLFSRTKKYLLEQDQELYNRIDSLLLEANNRSRAISHELFSPTLKEFGIFKALEELFQNMQKAKPELETRLEVKGSDENLEDSVALNLYRIVQELINNTLKYAQASQVHLSVEVSDKQVYLKYADNGVGVDLSTGKHGVGLKSIQSRAKRIQGSVRFDSEVNKGFKASVEVVGV